MSLIASTSRFAVVGLICALTHNAIMIGLDHWRIHYAVALVVSYVVVVFIGYVLHVRFTFREQASLHSLWRYALSMAANYPLTLGLLFVFCDLIGMSVKLAAPVATVLLFVWNYAASRWAIARPVASTPPGTS